MNLKIREFALSLEKYVESADIPWEVKKMILKELYENAIEQADRVVLEELDKRDSEEQEERMDE